MYDQKEARKDKLSHAQQLGVKNSYPDMELPYHDRPNQAVIDGMHTIKDVVHNIMQLIHNNKNTYRIPQLELYKSDLAIADDRFTALTIPEWVDLPNEAHLFSKNSSLKSHDWKQVFCCFVVHTHTHTHTIICTGVYICRITFIKIMVFNL